MRDRPDGAYLSVADTIDHLPIGPVCGEHNHIIPQSNDYHETVPGTVWLRDVALQAGWFCGGTSGNEQRTPRASIQPASDGRSASP